MKNVWSLKGQNRGASLIAVLVTIMFVGVIGVVISQITITNIQMKEMEQRGKTNFYDAEKVVDDLAAGLNTQAATAMQKAYSSMLSNYRTVTSSGGSVQDNFGRRYMDNLIAYFGVTAAEGGAIKTKKEGDGTDAKVLYQIGSYDLTKVKNCFSDASLKDLLITEAGANEYHADYNNGTFIMKDIKVTMKNPDTGYVTTVQTDMVFNTPVLNFEGTYMVKEFMRYSLIANKSINMSASHVIVDGNVYAGADGIYASNSGVNGSIFKGKTIITRGEIRTSSDAQMTVGGGLNSNIWAENVRVMGNSGTKLTLDGNIYISDDLEMDGKNATVFLKGNYFGYNFQKNYGGAFETGVSAQYSSAIAINARDSKLDMTGLTQLMLAGRTYLKRKVGSVDVGRADVPLGESLSVRSNQMAYYVPTAFLDTSVEPVVFKDTTGKEVSNYLGIGNIYAYVGAANPVTAFHYISNIPGTPGIAYYLKFASNGTDSAEQVANNFFSEFYTNNSDRVNPYGEVYVANDGLILPTSGGSTDLLLTLKGDIMYRTSARANDTAPSNLQVGRIVISSTHMDTLDFLNYAGRLAKKYKSLQLYLEENHAGISADDVRFANDNKKDNPGETLLDNLLATATDTANYKYAIQEALKDLTEKKKIMRYNASGVRDDEHGEYVVILADNGPSMTGDPGSLLKVEQSYKGGIIIATGDVYIESAADGSGREFTGCIISGGEISFASNSTVNANELLVSQLFANDLRKSDRDFTQFFKGYEAVGDSDLGIVRIDEYLSYDNWTKTVDE